MEIDNAYYGMEGREFWLLLWLNIFRNRSTSDILAMLALWFESLSKYLLFIYNIIYNYLITLIAYLSHLWLILLPTTAYSSSHSISSPLHFMITDELISMSYSWSSQLSEPSSSPAFLLQVVPPFFHTPLLSTSAYSHDHMRYHTIPLPSSSLSFLSCQTTPFQLPPGTFVLHPILINLSSFPPLAQSIFFDTLSDTLRPFVVPHQFQFYSSYTFLGYFIFCIPQTHFEVEISLLQIPFVGFTFTFIATHIFPSISHTLG